MAEGVVVVAAGGVHGADFFGCGAVVGDAVAAGVIVAQRMVPGIFRRAAFVFLVGEGSAFIARREVGGGDGSGRGFAGEDVGGRGGGGWGGGGGGVDRETGGGEGEAGKSAGKRAWQWHG